MEVLQDWVFRPCFSEGKKNYTIVALPSISRLSDPYALCSAPFSQVLGQLSIA